MPQPLSPGELRRGPAAPPNRSGILTTALTRRGRERFSGTLRLDGDQAGNVIMQDGKVVAASTPVAPGIESLLLRSGRISEVAWTDVFEAAAPYGRLSTELIERDLLGAAAIEVLTQTAVFDAIFAMALCGVNSCTAEPANPDHQPPLLPAEPGLDTDRIVRETSRRLTVAAGWHELGLTLHSKPHRVSAERTPEGGRGEILAKINGRRTTRDLAFNVGRGLFSVMTDLATLLKDDLVTLDPPAKVPPPERQPEPPQPKPSGPSKLVGLPRRRRRKKPIPPDS